MLRNTFNPAKRFGITRGIWFGALYSFASGRPSPCALFHSSTTSVDLQRNFIRRKPLLNLPWTKTGGGVHRKQSMDDLIDVFHEL